MMENPYEADVHLASHEIPWTWWNWSFLPHFQEPATGLSPEWD